MAAKFLKKSLKFCSGQFPCTYHYVNTDG